jgi:hypothetical protein
VRTGPNIINVVLSFNMINMYESVGEQVRLLREEVARAREETARMGKVLEDEVAKSSKETARIGQVLEEFIARSGKRNQPTEPDNVKRLRVGQSPRMFADHDVTVWRLQ